jgi:hypothetical protein
VYCNCSYAPLPDGTICSTGPCTVNQTCTDGTCGEQQQQQQQQGCCVRQLLKQCRFAA